MQINIITLGCNDLSVAESFYTKWFATKPAAASNEHIKFFNLNGVKLALYSREMLAKDVNVVADGSGFTGITFAINADSQQEVDEIFAKGIASGAKSIKQPEKVFWGGYSAYLSDIDGHLWEIAWNPYFTKNENGELNIL